MKVLECIPLTNSNYSDDGACRTRVTGARIVFGDVDILGEIYYMTVPVEEFGFSEEDLRFRGPLALIGRRNSLDLKKLKLQAHKVLCRDLYPEFDPDLCTEADKTLREDRDRFFFKAAPMFRLDPEETYKEELLKIYMSTELRAAEEFRRSPHPNVANYIGCEVQGDLVTGFYYECHFDRLEDLPRPLNVGKHMADIREGIEHIHGLGYCHNDINPDNIRIREEDGTAVIIDFDACLPKGEKLVKSAPEGFAREADISEEENDWFGLEKMEEWMHDLNGRNTNANYSQVKVQYIQ